MIRHYFTSNNLDDLDKLAEELEGKGVVTPQIHALSKDDSGVDKHEHLHNIESIFKQDIVHGTIIGAIFGVLAAVLVLAIGYLTTLPETDTSMDSYGATKR